MASFKTILRAFGELGPRPMMLYGLYQVLFRAGWFKRRTPQSTWQDAPLANWLRRDVSSDPEEYLKLRKRTNKRFFLNPDDAFVKALEQLIEKREDALIEQADAVLAGRFRLFGTDDYKMGFPPDWGRYVSLPGSTVSTSVALDRHWTAYNDEDFSEDIKLLWEPARFGWVFPLARAYVLTDDARYADAIWYLIDSWRENNPPNTGPHWISAQEVAIRALVIVFALQVTFQRVAESPEKLCEIAQMIAVHTTRIPPTLLYARAQSNNHLLVEAVALYTVGLMFPELRKAKAWHKLGRRWLEHSLRCQIFTDGGYVQHSINYHRLALQAGLWAARLAERNNEPLSTNSLDALARATRWLSGVIAGEDGQTSNLGPNDGGLIFPLSSCAFEDHRPTCQAASHVFLGNKYFDQGPWDEELLWFGVRSDTQPNRARGQRVTSEADNFVVNDDFASIASGDSYSDSGFYILRGERTWSLLRCAHFHSRPGHSDQLHFDLWWRGQNVACDVGSYLYNGQPPWDNPWVGAAFHNTVLVDGQEPMDRAGRFLWVDWAQGRFLGRWRAQNGEIEVLAGEHYGYRSCGVTHRRTIARLGDDLWLVVDDLLGQGVHNISIGWTMPDLPWKLMDNHLKMDLDASNIELSIEGSVGHTGVYRGGTLVAGTEVLAVPELAGWRSIRYGLKTPCLRMVKQCEVSLPDRQCTWWQLAGVNKDEVEIDWSDPGQAHMPFSSLQWQGQQLDINDAYFINPSSFHRAG